MKEHPDHDVDIINIANRIDKIEREVSLLNDIVEKMTGADTVIWSFPVYYVLVPAQLKRFVELLFGRCQADLFKEKYATSFTTSINFMDHTAHNYMQGVCEALGFSYVRGYSANMNDFFKEDQRARMVRFFGWFAGIVEEKVPVARKYPPMKDKTIVYVPGRVEEVRTSSDRRVLVLTDTTDADANLKQMVAVFRESCSMPVEVKNLHDIDMKRGCLGCCTCGYDNTCVQKDGYVAFFNEHVKKADVLIIAGSIRDHYLSSTWKRFFDRSFFNGHAPVLMGKRLGFIISGPLGQVPNLGEILGSFGDIWRMKFTGIVTDEHGTSEKITAHIRGFARQLELAGRLDLDIAPTFYQVGGYKLFRDFIYNASAVFAADHIFYKKHGLYRDFPQRKIKKRISNALFKLLISIRPIRKRIHKGFIQGMAAPYEKVLKKN
jgi:multimeric flavodoxin WrbA